MEKTTLEEHEEKSLKNGIYPIFWKSPFENKVYMQDSDHSYFYVQVIGMKDGGYMHHRGKAVMPAVHLSELVPATHLDYINMMKDYFAADKKLRDKFIEKLYGSGK